MVVINPVAVANAQELRTAPLESRNEALNMRKQQPVARRAAVAESAEGRVRNNGERFRHVCCRPLSSSLS